MLTCLLVISVASLPGAEELPGDKLDLYTVTLFDGRLAAVCRDLGLHTGYGGNLAWQGWPLGLRAVGDSSGISFGIWDVTTDQRESIPTWRANTILLRPKVSLQRHPEDFATCVVNGKELHLCVTHVLDNRSVDDPIPDWALNEKGKKSAVTVRKLLQQLRDEPKPPVKFEGTKVDATVIELKTVSRLHDRLSRVARGTSSLCVYYRGPLGRHPTLGRAGIRLPEAATPSLTWTLTHLDENIHDTQHLVFQVTASLAKRPDSIGTYTLDGKTLHLSVSNIVGGRTPDEKIPELSDRGKAQLSVREFLTRLSQ